MSEQEPWAPAEDVAKHLGISRDTVYRWVEKKGPPGQKMGRLWKLKLSQVDVWVGAGGAAVVSTAGEA